MQAVILAAGESSRFWPLNLKHKSLIRALGKPLISHTIEGLKAKEINDITVVQSPAKEVEKELAGEIKYVIQSEPAGMGDAIAIAQSIGSTLVFHAHKIDAGNQAEIMMKKSKEGAELVFSGSETKQPQLYGILKLEGDRVKGVVEKPEKGKEPSNIRVVGSYLLPSNFSEYYKKVTPHQYAFEDALNLYAKENDARLVMLGGEHSSLKYPWQLFEVTKSLLDSKLKGLETHPTAKIAKNVIIEGNVYIGENTRVLEGVVIKGPCYIGSNCLIGNHSVVRDYTNLEDGVVVGAHAEVARCVFQKNVHIHSGYFADSILGEAVHVGAGTVAANRRLDRTEIKAMVKGEKIGTGLTSLGVIIGNNTYVGINVSFMPGVLIGSHCVIGPGSVIFENIEDNTTFITEFKTIKKKNER